jgi:hypothetical protein
MGVADRQAELVEKLERMDFYAHLIRTNIYEWDRLVTDKKRAELPDKPPAWLADSWAEFGGPDFMRERGLMKERQKISAYGMLRASDRIWGKAISMGVEDTRGDMKPMDIAKWAPEDFKTGTLIMKPDISQLVLEGGGIYSLEYHPLDGPEPEISEISIIITDTNTGEERVIRHIEPRVTSRYVNSFKMEIPERIPGTPSSLQDYRPSSDEKVSLRLGLEGARSTGVIKLRRVWSYKEFPWDKQTILMEE